MFSFVPLATSSHKDIITITTCFVIFLLMGPWDVGANWLQSAPSFGPSHTSCQPSLMHSELPAIDITLACKAVCCTVLGSPYRTQLAIYPSHPDLQRHRESVTTSDGVYLRSIDQVAFMRSNFSSDTCVRYRRKSRKMIFYRITIYLICLCPRRWMSNKLRLTEPVPQYVYPRVEEPTLALIDSIELLNLLSTHLKLPCTPLCVVVK